MRRGKGKIMKPRASQIMELKPKEQRRGTRPKLKRNKRTQTVPLTYHAGPVDAELFTGLGGVERCNLGNNTVLNLKTAMGGFPMFLQESKAKYLRR